MEWKVTGWWQKSKVKYFVIWKDVSAAVRRPPRRPEGVLSQGPDQGALVQLVQDQFKRYRQINITFYKLVKGKFLVPVI